MKRRLKQQGLRQGAFTLIELITVILVLSTVSIGVVSYISMGIDVYQDSVGRDRQIADSRFLITRLTRELREALPNSVRVNASNSCIEFVPIAASSTYIDLAVAPDSARDSARIVLPADTPMLASGDKMAVYPLSPAEIYVNPSDPSNTTGKVFSLAVAIPSGTSSAIISFDKAVQFQAHSPTERYFVIANAVSYCVEGTDVKRYSDYWPIGAQQSPPSSVTIEVSLMAQNQANLSPFYYHEATLTRNAVAQLNFEFSYDDETLALYHEVHIVNVP